MTDQQEEKSYGKIKKKNKKMKKRHKVSNLAATQQLKKQSSLSKIKSNHLCKANVFFYCEK